ncbi:MAG TPA: ABC transporter substrate-binding protein [Thermomicrobiaceae bacterium]|nr:ABC transporter substrate-binding protein [Thermomicrobiaceae bacterium]
MTKRALAVLLLLLIPALAACGSGSGSGSSPDVSVALDWYPNSDHAGLYLAQSRGYFKDQGLSVKLQVPSNPDDVLKLVGTGKNTFGVSYEPDVLLARAQGVPVVSIAAIVQQPLDTIMTLKSSGITQPKQLAGKTIGSSGLPGDQAILSTMMAADGSNVSKIKQQVNVGYDLVQALISKRVDAIIGGYFTHEAILAEQQGYPVNVMHVQDWGVPTYYELVIVTSEDMVKNHPETVQRFVNAVVQGYDGARQDPTAALNAIAASYKEMDRKVENVGIQRLLPLFTAGAPSFGWQTSQRWVSYANWMTQHKLLKGGNPNDAFTNKFVEAASKSPK